MEFDNGVLLEDTILTISTASDTIRGVGVSCHAESSLSHVMLGRFQTVLEAEEYIGSLLLGSLAVAVTHRLWDFPVPHVDCTMSRDLSKC